MAQELQNADGALSTSLRGRELKYQQAQLQGRQYPSTSLRGRELKLSIKKNII